MLQSEKLCTSIFVFLCDMVMHLQITEYKATQSPDFFVVLNPLKHSSSAFCTQHKPSDVFYGYSGISVVQELDF